MWLHAHRQKVVLSLSLFHSQRMCTQVNVFFCAGRLLVDMCALTQVSVSLGAGQEPALCLP